MLNEQMKGVFRCHSKVYNGKLNLDSHGSSSPQTEFSHCLSPSLSKTKMRRGLKFIHTEVLILDNTWYLKFPQGTSTLIKVKASTQRSIWQMVK